MEVRGVRFPFHLMWIAGTRMLLSHPAGPNQILERIIVRVHPNPKSYYTPCVTTLRSDRAGLGCRTKPV